MGMVCTFGAIPLVLLCLASSINTESRSDSFMSFAPPPLQECFSNGTMTALAVKVESAPNLNPGQLTLSDPACGPTYSDDRFAYFHFTVNSCGTTRKVK